MTNRKNSSVEESWEEEKARRDAEEKEREEQLSKEEKEKASLVASFFGGTAKPAASKPGAGVGRLPASRAPAKVVERASFTPEGGAADVQVIFKMPISNLFLIILQNNPQKNNTHLETPHYYTTRMTRRRTMR